ncbi:double-strand-break repair protein rad21-like protein 1 isoform X1 [Micropterus salmoides]|uniref:double-strand-break repair protein rad21-like protein 1 isoform X1 n=1 Tax=Micropterus salmoides TaxID=27706 RepID=UPI0018EB0B68|nr:double-strand-break repair protein rad21-like protein 1 isoform X1 [Micropterus salmoides]XP_038578219.1 double-strand-break repair protein rad21-like protein 1 isoform X1 [Micropterus salmoides]XP_038578220.1 double-strand-break repair protein rad21-like protein 1 isoform X1 [Micropterus salmoides]
MFYTQLFTSKRGPLAKIWLAAHWERKLTKAHVFECNLETSIRDIISPTMKIGLRTSGHLLIGVVRIYSKKAKYLLADCNDALVKIKMEFRPGQTDMPEEGLEATLKAITLIEDFTAFDVQLPHPSNIDVVDHFSLNQCRSEEITLKEDFGSGFLNLADFGDESQSHHNVLMDMSFQSLAQHGDAFGDEDKGFDLLDFLTNSSDHIESTDLIPEEPHNENPEISTVNYQQDADKMEVETPTLNQTTLLANEAEAFALEPVAITPNSEKKRGKRKRKLVVDQTKELSNESIRAQLSDYSDLVAPLDMAPPTLQLMHWKESGGADKLFAQPCSTVVSPQILELFAKSIFQVKYSGVCDEVEVIRQGGQEVQRDTSALTTDNASPVDSSIDPEKTHNAELTIIDAINDSQHENYPELAEVSMSCEEKNENRSAFTQPELPSEDSMFVHTSFMEQETQSTSLHTQSMLDSQDFEEKKISRRAQKLLNTLKSQGNRDTTFSLEALCEGGTRSQAATTFFCLLILKKQKALHLHQSAPYEDIFATPGPKFYD